MRTVIYNLGIKAQKEKQMQSNNRNNSLDLLRIISTIAVIIIHCNAHYYVADTPAVGSGEYLVESILNAITRFSVPAFIMISGAFNLGDKNSDFKSFYSKSGKKIFLPMLPIVLTIYVFLGAYQIIIKHDYVRPIMNFVTGGPFAYWFMYTLLFLYILTPVFVIFKRNVSTRVFEISASFLLVWACFSQMLSKQESANTIGVVFAYAGYYLMGRVIYERVLQKKYTSIFFPIVAIALITVSIIIRRTGFSYYESDQFISFFSPLTIIASLLIFIWFCSINVKRDFSWLSSKTFFIYLFHDIILVVAFPLLERFMNNQLLNIAIVVVFTFLSSLLCSIIYSKIWNMVLAKIEKKKMPYQMPK